MKEITTVGLDLAKNVFQVHAVDENGAVLVRRQVRRPIETVMSFVSQEGYVNRRMSNRSGAAGAMFMPERKARSWLRRAGDLS